MSDVNLSSTKTAESARPTPARAARKTAKPNTKKTDVAPLTPAQLAREHVKRYLIQRFYTRFHMSLILMSAGLAAMLGNWVMLHAGVSAMWLRYPLAITLAYLIFLAGVWLWLQYVQYTQGDGTRRTNIDGADVLNGDILPIGGGGSSSGDSFAGGGGSFDGGGAAGEWVEANPVQALASSGSAPSTDGGGMFSGIGKNLGDFGDLDGEAIVLIVLAIALILSLLLLSGYVIWFAPDILSEALFGATLAGSLARTAKRQDADGWVLGVVKKTWWPFAIVMVISMVFAIYAASHYPGASTFGAVLSMAAGS
jgi:hypothetical protein